MKNLEKMIVLESVGSALVNGLVYPLNADRTIDYENGCELSECIENDDWFNSLSNDDYYLIRNYNLVKNLLNLKSL